jgi:hypothetical protein
LTLPTAPAFHCPQPIVDHDASIHCRVADRQLGKQARKPAQPPSVHSLDALATRRRFALGKDAALKLAPAYLKVRK